MNKCYHAKTVGGGGALFSLTETEIACLSFLFEVKDKEIKKS